MMRTLRNRKHLSRAFTALALIAALATASPALAQGEQWVGTWATALVARGGGGGGFGGFGGGLSLNDQTLRQITHISLGGERIRVVVSNAFGSEPLRIGAANVALRDRDARILPDSSRALRFGGRPSTTIAPGEVLASDPVSLSVPDAADLAIDLYLPDDLRQATLSSHQSALQTSFVSGTGNRAGAVDFPVDSTTRSFFFLARIEVEASAAGGAVVAFGDSITDGTRSTPDTNSRWPDFLAQRLIDAGIELGVLNVGIAGNQVLRDGAGQAAIRRFDRDALQQAGVAHVILLEGINDINIGRGNTSAEDIVGGYRQLIASARAAGVRIYGATLTPASATGMREAVRSAVNEWIRTGGEFDGVVDFDQATRDPARPTRILPRFNPGDNLHMNDAGYEAMGAAVDLSLFDAQRSAAAGR